MEISEKDQRDILAIREKTPSSDQERIARFIEKQAVTEVLAQYGHHSDLHQYDEMVTLFTEDIERVLGGTLAERVKGKGPLLERLKKPTYRRADGAQQAVPFFDRRSRHLMAVPIVKLSDDAKMAWATAHYMIGTTLTRDGKVEKSTHEGTYLVTLVKQGPDWKIQKYVINTEIGSNAMIFGQKQ